MDIECEHKRLEEAEGVVFCTMCGLVIEKFFGFSRGRRKEKKGKK